MGEFRALFSFFSCRFFESSRRPDYSPGAINMTDFVTPAMDYAIKARQCDEEQQFPEAARFYMQAVEYFLAAMRHEKNNPTKKDVFKKKADELLARAEQIKKYLSEKEANPEKKDESSGAVKTKKEKSDEEESKRLSSVLEGAIVTKKPDVRWEDVAGLEGAKEALREAVIMPTQFPQLFAGNRQPWKGILLYGPPGTGKTYLAMATAYEAQATFIEISAADLMSKWLGESEKMVKYLFKLAKEKAPCIIFIDEVDSLTGSRGEGEHESTRRVKNEFLSKMQGLGSGGEQVLVLGATNMPWGLDLAFRRRFERRIYIPLPDVAARTVMFRLHVGKTPHTLSQSDFDYLAERTEGFSGSDINNLVKQALMEPLKNLPWATHFKYVEGRDLFIDGRVATVDDDVPYCYDLVTPCAPSDPAGFEATVKTIDPKKLVNPVVTMNDFLACMVSARPTVSSDDLDRYEQFTAEFGMEGT
eukprot:NODE_1157_length_1547_cov_26.845127_g959_i0.p1 GENE.NODE_1157_length_1547_cov_26.845127_g959_i0~~NODE_1157_length_1547_cov_26.845127_g959_i0.p1  ORF type:complete len:473 (+),score=119.74 NODE_1157_length_1547_cov_26.845127_g959_i0:3-1421(+)